MQGLVAVAATSIVVVILNLSSKYFKLSQLWLERSALILLVLLGLYWIAQGLKGFEEKAIFRIYIDPIITKTDWNSFQPFPNMSKEK